MTLLRMQINRSHMRFVIWAVLAAIIWFKPAPSPCAWSWGHAHPLEIASICVNTNSALQQALEFDPTSDRFAGATRDTVKIWSSVTGELLLTLKGYDREVTPFTQFSADGSRILTSDYNGKVKIRDSHTGAFLFGIERGHWPAMSPDGKRVLVTSETAPAFVVAMTPDAVGVDLNGDSIKSSGSFSPDGKKILTGGKVAAIWDATTGQQIKAFHATGYLGYSPISDPTSRIFALRNWNSKTLQIRSLETGELISEITPPGESSYWTNAIAFDPSGERIAIACSDSAVRIWNLRSGDQVQTINGHDKIVMAVSFSHDGKRIVTGSADQTAKVWDATLGTLLVTLPGHTLGLGFVAFTRDDRRVVTASDDKTAKIWDVSPEAIARLEKLKIDPIAGKSQPSG
jgi:WD40 repeat protein